ncbi:MAG: SlyX family protein [Desulfuromonadales bacterium]|nr:SlyX family protein [Desulfuromonadales bacterium]
MDELKERVIELEIRYAHQSALVEELNVELTAANSRINQLERDVNAMRDMMKGLEPDFIESPDE